MAAITLARTGTDLLPPRRRPPICDLACEPSGMLTAIADPTAGTISLIGELAATGGILYSSDEKKKSPAGCF
jgi:hypothetical protein